MKSSPSLFLSVALFCIAALGAALYLQIVEEMMACPLCIIQRYLFTATAIVCLIFAWLPAAYSKIGSGLALLTALGGVGTAGWHLWVQAHPGTSCGIDPLQTTLNTLPTATLLPTLFKANGLCALPYPFFGLALAQWSLICFALIAILLARRALQRA